jgi:long-chain acyl-CoA synthetase
MNIAQNIERSRRFFADKPALIFEGRPYSYRELDEMVNRLANGLSGLGVQRGDRLALFLPNIPEFVIAYLAGQKLGAITVSVNALLTSREVHFILADCSAVVVITTPELQANVPAAELPHLRHIVLVGEAAAGNSLAVLIEKGSAVMRAVEMAPHDPAAIVYSSGTTGVPKGVTLSHGNVISNMYAKNHYCGMTADDRLLLFVPLFHCFGQNAVLNSGLNAGATIVLHRKFELDEILYSLAANEITMFFAVPTIYLIILNQVSSLSPWRTVRYYFSAAAPLSVEVAQRWQEQFGRVIHEGYGLTETSPFASYNHHLQYKFGSIGTPIENVEMKIAELESGQAVEPGQIGEIAVRGPNVMLGYWNRPEETSQAIRQGWFYTGDSGRMDEEGYFYIVDRIKDMINVAGLKVYPTEVENVLYQHPAVAEAAVFGLPVPITGEQVAAHIVRRPGYSLSEAELFALCRQQIASFKVPSSIKFVNELPKSATGKILKRVLRETAQRGMTA